jgi:hypothetical protein
LYNEIPAPCEVEDGSEDTVRVFAPNMQMIGVTTKAKMKAFSDIIMGPPCLMGHLVTDDVIIGENGRYAHRVPDDSLLAGMREERAVMKVCSTITD